MQNQLFFYFFLPAKNDTAKCGICRILPLAIVSIIFDFRFLNVLYG